MPELSQEKIFQYLTAVLGLLACVLIVREIFFTSGELTMPDIVFPITEVNVRTEIFDEFNIGELTPFYELGMPEVIGRDMPFDPYSIAEYNAALEALRTATTTATTTEPVATTTEPVATTTEPVATTTEE